ncbi:MAG: cell division protein FtsH, partial [Verrucomicrobiaceae bacterium]
MFDEEPKPPRNNKRNQEPQFNWKGLVLLGASALIIAWAFFLKQTNASGKEKNYAEFKKIVMEGRLVADENSPVYLVNEPGTGIEYIE